MPFSQSGGGTGGSSAPGFEIGYDQITGVVNIASTTEATGTTIITCAAHTFDGNPVLAQFFAPFVQSTSQTGSQSVTVCLFESSTEIGRLCTWSVAATTPQIAVAMTGLLRFTPSAASHTYTVTAFATNTLGTPQVGAGASGTGAYNPAFIRFTKV